MLLSFLHSLLASTALASALPSQEAPRVFPVGRASKDERLHREALTTESPAVFAPSYDPLVLKERAVEVRKRVQLAAGLWPYPGAALESYEHRKSERDDYSVTNLIFQSHVFSFIPANIYEPKGPGRKPLILIAHGHWPGGRLHERSDEEARELVERGVERSFEAAKYPLQAACAQLARMGCVVFVQDQMGFGELREWGHEDALNSVEHLQRMQLPFGVQAWNSMMSLYFAWNRDRIDQERVGMAGFGAGALQAVVTAVQERKIKAVFASCFLSEENQGLCRCENPAHLRVGTSNLEIASAIAPRALAVVGGPGCADEAEKQGMRNLARVWRSLGEGSGFQRSFIPGHRHDLDLGTREAMYEWFNAKLGLGFDSPIVEGSFEPIPPSELRVYDEQHRRPPDHAQDPVNVLLTYGRGSTNQLDQIVEETPHRYGVMRGIVFEGLRMMLATEYPDPAEVVADLRGTARGEGRTILRLALARRGTGEEVPAVLVMPDAWNGTVLVAISERGKQEFFAGGSSTLAGVGRVAEQGVALLAPDLLLTGEYLASRGDEAPALPVDEKRHATDPSFTYCYNRTLIAERVHDILTAVAYARSLEGTKVVNLAGTGLAGPWVVMARALIGDVKRTGDAVQRTAVQVSWDFPQVHRFDDPNFLPGSLRYGGLAFFSSMIAPAELRFLPGPGQSAAVTLPEILQKSYRSLEAYPNLRAPVGPDPGPTIDWLAGG